MFKSPLKSLAFLLFGVLLAAAFSVQAATNAIETPIALFSTSLVSAISSSANSMNLVSGITLDGVALPTSTYSFIIDEGTAQQEFVKADCTGATCTNMVRGLSAITGTSTVTALEYAHRRGASVSITDAPLLLNLTRIFQGIGTFPTLLSYTPTMSTSSVSGGQIPDAAWVLSQTSAVTSVSNSDGTLTISPTNGNVISSFNLAHGNVYTASSTFTSGLTSIFGTTTSATSTSFFATTASTTNLFVGGKVGIGTTSPTSANSNAVTVSNNQSVLVTENKVATSTSQTIDWRQGNSQLMQIGTAGITVTQTGYQAGQHLLLTVCNPSSGTAGTITWPGIEWVGSTAPTQTTTANVCDVWSFIATQASSTAGSVKLFGTAALNFN